MNSVAIMRGARALALALTLTLLAGCSGGGSGGDDSTAKKAGTMGVNVFLVAMDESQKLYTLLTEFKRLMEKSGIAMGPFHIYLLTGPDAERLTYVDLDSNSEQELFMMSAAADNTYLNFFLVRSISGFGILGLAPHVNGPAQNGQWDSGVLINTFGGLPFMSTSDLLTQGATMAHEAGHFLGLWHTTEQNGTNFDPLSDTPECQRETYDSNKDGIVSSSECRSVDGPNLMFWSDASYPQDTLSDMQNEVIFTHPLVE